jgi:hypothetical protein
MNVRRETSAAILVACAIATSAAAQGLVDPTRPPPAFMPLDPKAPVQSTSRKTDGLSDVPVQLLLVGKTRRFAIINGELVGEKTPGTKIVATKGNGLTVESERGRETLNLFPDVQKTPPRKQAGMGNKDQK